MQFGLGGISGVHMRI